GKLREERRSKWTGAAGVAGLLDVGAERDGLRHDARRAATAEPGADQSVRRLLQVAARTGEGTRDALTQDTAMTTPTTSTESARAALTGWKLWLARIVIFGFCGAMIAAFIRASISDPWLPVFTVVLVGLGALAAFFPRVNRLMQTAFTG